MSAAARSESETRCPMCERVIREDDLYEDGCPFCGTYVEEGDSQYDDDERFFHAESERATRG